MVTDPSQGEVWWAEASDKRRPVLVITRSEAIPVLDWILVAPVTRTIRGIPTEIAVGLEEGLPVSSVANFDSLQPIRKAFLTTRVRAVDLGSRRICEALEALADC